MLIPRIVVVEQDDSQRLLYKWEFEDEGYEVTCCGKLEDTASIAARKPADLVLMDAGSCRTAASAPIAEIRAVRDPSTAQTTARESLESHLMAFAAEQARVNGAVVSMNELRRRAEVAGDEMTG